MGDARDLTGVWFGRYWGDGGQDNGFIAMLEEAGRLVTGTITEPDDHAGAGAVRRAFVRGHRDGQALAFLKQYDGGGGWDHAVRYAGTVNDDGTEATGSWTVEWLRGSFTMQREKFAAEELEEEREVEVPAGSAVPSLALSRPSRQP